MLLCISFHPMRENQDYKVANGYQSDDTRVFERVQTTQERQRYNDEPITVVRGQLWELKCSLVKTALSDLA